MATLPKFHSHSMSEDEYLRSQFEPNAEYINGIVREKALPTWSHADWQLAICLFFRQHNADWNIRVATELQVRTKPGHWRVPDVTVFSAHTPRQERLTHPPIAVFEVLSESDAMTGVFEKFDEYEAMGIPQIWLVNPASGQYFRRYQLGNLNATTEFREDQIVADLSVIRGLLQG